jgi:hypothetical protein
MSIKMVNEVFLEVTTANLLLISGAGEDNSASQLPGSRVTAPGHFHSGRSRVLSFPEQTRPLGADVLPAHSALTDCLPTLLPIKELTS